MKGKPRRILTREEWQNLAEKARQINSLMGEVDATLADTLTVAGMKPYRKAFGKVQSLKCRLDSLAVDQHRDWPEAPRLFYGNGWTFHSEWR